MLSNRSVSNGFCTIYLRYVTQIENYIRNATIFNEYGELKPYLGYVLETKGKNDSPLFVNVIMRCCRRK
jgi:hypothetical protein